MKEKWKKGFVTVKHVVELEEAEPFMLGVREMIPVKMVMVHEFTGFDNVLKESRCWLLVGQRNPAGEIVQDLKWKIAPCELPGGKLTPALQDLMDRSLALAPRRV